MARTTETPTFGMDVKPVHEGVYKVGHVDWPGFWRFSLWRDGQWHIARQTADHAEAEHRRSIVLYERGVHGWRGVVEKPEWASA